MKSATFCVCCIFLFQAGSIAAAIPLQVTEIESISPTGRISSFVPLDERLLFSAGPIGSQQLYSFNGATFTLADNLSGAIDPRIRLPLPGLANGGGAILDGEFYFNADSPAGESLFKSDGTQIDLVADIDPGNHPDQTAIREIIATPTHVFVSALGANGTELFRTDGMTTTEFDIYPGMTSSVPIGLRGFGDRVLFRATGPEPGVFGTYLAGASGAQQLLPVPSSSVVELNDSLYWISGGTMYRYDGVTTTPAADLSGITSLSFQGTSQTRQYSDGTFLTLTGRGPNGWSIYTWDGTSLSEFDAYPGGDGSLPGIIHYLDGSFYFMGNNGTTGFEPYRTNGTSGEVFDLAPGPTSSNPDYDTAAVVNGAVIFRATGPAGNELYRADASGITLLADIHPTGDAFPLTVGTPQEYEGELYFRASTPGTGAEIYKTDGNTVTLLADIVSGPMSSNGNFVDGLRFFTDFPLPWLSVDFMPSQSGGDEVFLTDGDEVVSVDDAIASLAGIQERAGITGYDGDLLFFTTSGRVFRVSLVPEASSSLLLGGGLIALARAARGRLRRKASSTR